VATALTAILTAAGILAHTASAIHATLKDMAGQQGVKLSRNSA
jgi:hypothetical protein